MVVPVTSSSFLYLLGDSHSQVPFGDELLGDYRGIRDRASQEVGKVVRAQRRYVRSAQGKLVNDRKFSYASLAAVYLGQEQCDGEVGTRSGQ